MARAWPRASRQPICWDPWSLPGPSSTPPLPRRSPAARGAHPRPPGELAGTVAHARFAKPIDPGLMAQLAAEHDLLVTVEEGVLAGGFGSGGGGSVKEAGATPRTPRGGAVA